MGGSLTVCKADSALSKKVMTDVLKASDCLNAQLVA